MVLTEMEMERERDIQERISRQKFWLVRCLTNTLVLRVLSFKSDIWIASLTSYEDVIHLLRTFEKKIKFNA